MTPVVTMLVTALPDSMPIMALPRIATFAGPPEKRPAIAMVKFMNFWLPPLASKSAAKKTKRPI